MTHRLFEKSRIIAVLLVSVLLVSGFVTVPIYNAKAAVCNQYYLVLPGDDLYKIGLKYGVDWQTLASVNGIPNPYSVQAGQTLCISSPINTVYPTTNVYPVNSTYPTNYTYPNTDYPQNSNYPNNYNYNYNDNNTYPYRNCSQYYPVQYGDTLYRIAMVYGVSLTDLASLNGISSWSTIYPGQSICIPGQGYNPPPPPPPGCRYYYTVQYGDNLFRIGLRYGVSWPYLQQLNGLYNADWINAGQTLCVSP